MLLLPTSQKQIAKYSWHNAIVTCCQAEAGMRCTTVATFGVASASYYGSRVASSLGRLSQYGSGTCSLPTMFNSSQVTKVVEPLFSSSSFSRRHSSRVFVSLLFELIISLILRCSFDPVVRLLVFYSDCAPCDSIHLLWLCGSRCDSKGILD